MKPTKICIGTDFSENAQKAEAFGKLIAKKHRIPVVYVHTYLPPVIDPSTPVDIISQLQIELSEGFQKQLNDLCEQAKTEGIEASNRLIYSDVTNGILETAEDENCDFVVIGKTGQGSILDKIFGSNASNLVSKAKMPVLVIPSDVENTHIKNVMYGTELEFDELEILRSVFAFTKTMDAALTLLHVEAPFEANIHPDHQFLSDIEAAFSEETFTYEKVTAESISEGILQTAYDKNTDLVIVSAHHRNFIEELIIPSKTKKIVVNSNVPLLIFHFEE
jgi:nucleotide-binding universal stress UspA family protein